MKPHDHAEEQQEWKGILLLLFEGVGPILLTVLQQVATCPRVKTSGDRELGGYGRGCGSGKSQGKGAEYDQSRVGESQRITKNIFKR